MAFNVARHKNILLLYNFQISSSLISYFYENGYQKQNSLRYLSFRKDIVDFSFQGHKAKPCSRINKFIIFQVREITLLLTSQQAAQEASSTFAYLHKISPLTPMLPLYQMVAHPPVRELVSKWKYKRQRIQKRSSACIKPKLSLKPCKYGLV